MLLPVKSGFCASRGFSDVYAVEIRKRVGRGVPFVGEGLPKNLGQRNFRRFTGLAHREAKQPGDAHDDDHEEEGCDEAIEEGRQA